jgi:hypothetical protein
MNWGTRFGFISPVVQSWMDDQRLEDGLATTKSVMSTGHTGPINVL